ncbi:MAG: PhoU domain-containing protein [Candidatus Woesearchaeota archaeon]
MRRKLVKQGRNALTVTLPTAWLEKNNLMSGSEVFLEERDHGLLVSGRESAGGNKKDVSIKGMDPMIKRILGAIYKAGYDEVDVTFDTAKELETAQEVIREEFIGFEVTQHGKHTLNVKKVSSIDIEEFNTMIRRMFLIIKSMADDSLDAINNDDPDFMRMIILRDKDVNKIADFCRRALNTSGHLIEGRTPPLYFISEQLEKIGDNYRDLCKFMIKKRIKPSKEVMGFFSEVNSFFEMFYELYFNFSLKKMAEFGKRRYELVDESEKMIGFASKNELMFLFYMKEVIENTFDMNGPLMAAKL